MTFNPETLVERNRLKSQVRRWRLAAILLVAFLGLMNIAPKSVGGAPAGMDYIARVEIKGIINSDKEILDGIKSLADNAHVKAVLLQVDSPGGTAVGGEEYYQAIEELQKKKPVVALFNNISTSAAYLLAVPADRIYAHKATITGSIGALIEVPNVKGLADKLGVEMIAVKTGALKGAPSPFDAMTDDTKQMLQGMVDNFLGVFTESIVAHRHIPMEQVKQIADGRVFTGLQAVDNHLVDEIGGEDEALKWLQTQRHIPEKLKVYDVKLKKDKTGLLALLTTMAPGNTLIPKVFSLHGLLSIWQNSAIF